MAKTYEKASPDLIETLENVTVTSRTIKKKDDDLEQALSGLTGLAKVTRVTLGGEQEAAARPGPIRQPAVQAAGHVLA